MSLPSIVQPIIITGPAIVTWNGFSYYFKSGIKSDYKRDTIQIESLDHGIIDERAKSQHMEISGTPVGMISTAGMSAMFPYGVSAVGKSILTATNLPLVIQTRYGGTSNTGQTITYPRAALTKAPVLNLGPGTTALGDITFTCLGDPTVAATGATAWETIADNAFADTNFNETIILTDIYTATYGTSPYAAMGSMAGFEVTIAYQTENIMADDFGIADIVLKGITATAKFAPSSLTEAQVWTLLNAQGTNVVQPGMSLSKSNTNLVIAGTGNAAKTLSVTINNAGPKQAGFMYDVAKHRHDAIEFSSKRTWTTGAANALFSFTVA